MNYWKKPEKPQLPEMYGFRATERVYIKGNPKEVYQVCNFVNGLVVLLRISPETVDNPLHQRQFSKETFRARPEDMISYDKDTKRDELVDKILDAKDKLDATKRKKL